MICQHFQPVLRNITDSLISHDCSWCGVQEPWKLLDEDGNEEAFEDTVSLETFHTRTLTQSIRDSIHRFTIER